MTAPLLPGERPPGPPATPPNRAGVQLRTRVLRLATRVPHDRLVALRADGGPGSLALRAADAIVRSGPVGVAAGGAVGGLLPTGLLTVDHAQAGLLARGSVEPPMAEALRRHLPRGGVLWDVGANLGYFALVGARIAGRDGEVLALDPVPAHVASVAAVAALNATRPDGGRPVDPSPAAARPDDGDGPPGTRPPAAPSRPAPDVAPIRPLELAAWSSDGETDLVLPADGAWAHLAATVAGRAPGERIRVRTARLDGLLAAGARRPDVVKIDVEGAELGVLEGLGDLVAPPAAGGPEATTRMAPPTRAAAPPRRPVLLVEAHDTADGVAAWAAAAGYRVEHLERPGPLAGPGGQLAALVPA